MRVQMARGARFYNMRVQAAALQAPIQPTQVTCTVNHFILLEVQPSKKSRSHSLARLRFGINQYCSNCALCWKLPPPSDTYFHHNAVRTS